VASAAGSNGLGAEMVPNSGRLLEALHTRQEPFAFVRARQSQRYAAETVKWSPCSPQQQSFARGLTNPNDSMREIALNLHKQDIFGHRCMIETSLVGYGIDAMNKR
jgi:hypothetical protein